MDTCEDDSNEKYKSLNSTTCARNPAFSLEEANYLIDLVERYKSVILNRSTSAAASHAKDAVWAKICKEFNEQNFKCERSTDSLKTKWENLKKMVRKVSKNHMDIKYNEYNDMTHRIVSLLCESINAPAGDISQNIVVDYADSREENDETDNPESWMNYSEEKLEDGTEDAELEDDKRRSLNFTPQECKLLLKCVKAEKAHVFSKLTTSEGVKLKNEAWTRITEAFNKHNYVERPTKVLRTKFGNIKYLARSIATKKLEPKTTTRKQKLGKDSNHVKGIKEELAFNIGKVDRENYIVEYHELENNDEQVDLIPDPLCAVLNSQEPDTSNNIDCETINNKDIVKLKMELLQYKLETAKLERERVKAASEAEAKERESRAIETALRLRSARLEALAAEMKIPKGHPGLRYLQNEACAQHYIISKDVKTFSFD